MKTLERKVSEAEAKKIASQLVKEWRTSKAKQGTARKLSRGMTATGKGLVTFSGLKVLERYGMGPTVRAGTKGGALPD